jgi:hypothetical protein
MVRHEAPRLRRFHNAVSRSGRACVQHSFRTADFAIAGDTTPGVGAVVMALRRDFPDAKILLLAIFPRSVPGGSDPT